MFGLATKLSVPSFYKNVLVLLSHKMPTNITRFLRLSIIYPEYFLVTKQKTRFEKWDILGLKNYQL